MTKSKIDPKLEKAKRKIELLERKIKRLNQICSKQASGIDKMSAVLGLVAGSLDGKYSKIAQKVLLSLAKE
jgi:predicted transcriptional regulator